MSMDRATAFFSEVWCSNLATADYNRLLAVTLWLFLVRRPTKNTAKGLRGQPKAYILFCVYVVAECFIIV